MIILYINNSNMSAILDAGTQDNNKVLINASNPNIGNIALHANSIYAGFGDKKNSYWASYRPQSGVGGTLANSQFDILITPTQGNSSIDIIDQLFLQIDIQPKSSVSDNDLVFKPTYHWLNRVEISMDGGSTLQTIYGDQLFASTINDSFISMLDNIKTQINTDPRNYLSWYDKKSTNLIFTDGSGDISQFGNAGGSTYLSQPYVVGSSSTTTFPTGLPVSTSFVNGDIIESKGGFLKSNPINPYTFYIPFYNTIMQQAKILLSELNSNIRLRFYINQESLLYDGGEGANITQVFINQATLWAYGSRLSNDGLSQLRLSYKNPVVSSFPYYVEFTQSISQVPTTNQIEVVLSNLTGFCSQLIFWLEDVRPTRQYPGQRGGVGTPGVNNNMLTLPLTNINFVNQDGSIYGSGTEIPQDLLILFNDYKTAPKSVSGDNRLYFRKYYYIDFSKFPIASASEQIFGGFYNLTGREKLRFWGVNDFKTATVNGPVIGGSGLELDEKGDKLVAATPSQSLYTDCVLHVVSVILAEAIENAGLVTVNLPRSLQ